MQGLLKDFCVADILQLLSQQQKTGVLIVEHEKKSAEVYFVSGEVTEVATPGDTDLLGTMLVKSGIITGDQLRHALEMQKNSLEHICAILLRQHLLSRENFEHIITTHAYEIFYEILKWHTGTYQFVTQKATRAPLVQLPGLESILLDVLRMIDEWPEITKVISSTDMLFDNNYAALPDLDHDEERVCGLVDGRRSVQDIIDASLFGSFYTCKALVQLLERGAIRLTSGRVENKVPRTAILAKYAISLGLGGCLAAMVVLALALPGNLALSILPAAGLLRQPQPPGLRQDALQAGRLKIEKALAMYFAKTGKYPEGTPELVASGMLAQEDLSALADNATVYVKTRGGFELKPGSTGKI